ncbi:hypothetical protein [Pseudomonas sp. DP16D-R1]|jgi:hypothetical protein|nr:hypothetical protein [Pseudomonas sp. DP16D-R1]
MKYVEASGYVLCNISLIVGLGAMFYRSKIDVTERGRLVAYANGLTI